MFGADGGGFAAHNHPSLPSLPPTTTLLSRPQPPFSAAHNHPFMMKVGSSIDEGSHLTHKNVLCFC
ncbi:hypothetical protein HanRHA438_Chr02g0056451 [Helianthus annuus]|nr:hypothetical protein HanRHA438_Chr02g0056451 [Helianthus annuus]